MTTFFIGDTHFGHKNIIKYQETERPFSSIEEHDEELIKRWNARVNKNDTVWHLGDFCFGEDKIYIAGRLNGNKKLILGNHDQYATKKYLQYFTRVSGVVEFYGMILSHIPVHPNQLEKRYTHNIHGHSHSKLVMAHNFAQYTGNVKQAEYVDKRYINVSVEQINLTPISWEEIKNKISPSL